MCACLAETKPKCGDLGKVRVQQERRGVWKVLFRDQGDTGTGRGGLLAPHWTSRSDDTCLLPRPGQDNGEAVAWQLWARRREGSSGAGRGWGPEPWRRPCYLAAGAPGMQQAVGPPLGAGRAWVKGAGFLVGVM